MGTVKQDANGVPEEWTLLHAGVNRLVKNGKDYELHLSVEDLEAIAAYQAKKGEAIPIDSNHYLHVLAASPPSSADGRAVAPAPYGQSPH